MKRLLSSAPITPSRRHFLKASALTIAVGVVRPTILLSSPTNADRPAVNACQLGALFNPYHRPSDWNLLMGHQPERLPLLGSYSSAQPETIDTQILWAKKMGLSFFMVLYSPQRSMQEGTISTLFEIAQRHAYKIALCVDPGQSWSHASTSASLLGSLNSYFSSAAYLRTSDGRPVLGFSDTAQIANSLTHYLAPGARALAIASVPVSSQWSPDNEDELTLARAMARRDAYLGLSLRQTDTPGMLQLVTNDPVQDLSIAIVNPTRSVGRGSSGSSFLRFPNLTTSPARDNYIILDSFNNWGISIPLEPSIAYREGYLDTVRQWSQSL